MGKHPNPKPQTTRTQDPTQVLVGEGKRGKQRSQDPQMGTSLAFGLLARLFCFLRLFGCAFPIDVCCDHGAWMSKPSTGCTGLQFLKDGNLVVL